ncbi:MAG TPA: EamA family transporter [Verrucomicrobiae bacterium]|nr:EamA family transporter [Verrucomicrobiae bacterium]
MLTKLLIILLIGLLFEAVGVVYLNKGLKQIGEVQKVTASEVMRIVKAGATNPNILLGVLFEAIFFGTLLVLMSKGTVSFIWPLTSLGFVLTTIAAKFILHEEVSWLRWCGVLLIMLGAGVITYTEKSAEGKAKVPANFESARGQ